MVISTAALLLFCSDQAELGFRLHFLVTANWSQIEIFFVAGRGEVKSLSLYSDFMVFELPRHPETPPQVVGACTIVPVGWLGLIMRCLK